MTTRRLLIGFFLLYGIIIPVLAREFVAENTSAAIAMIGACIIIALLFWSKRALFINIILAVYVFQNYLTRPFISIFEKELSPKNLAYIESNNIYFTSDAAAVVYWSLFSLLLAWLIGLLLIKSSGADSLFFAPKIFVRMDQVVLKGGLPFWLSWALLSALNYQTPDAGLRGAMAGESAGLFLWGLASFATINFVCLYVFVKRQSTGLKPFHYSLLVPLTVSTLYGVLSGSRSALFYPAILGLVYWLSLNIQKKWRLLSLVKIFFAGAFLLPTVALSGLFAQMLRPLYRQSDSINATDILGALNFESVILAKENLLFGITELLHRLSALKAQFYILNDWYMHPPFQYYNPLTTLMRTVNDLVPGRILGGYKPFEGMLTINQLFDYIYYDTFVNYSSEMWSIQGTLYLYFGHYFAPIVVFFMAVFVNCLYPSLDRAIRESAAFAAFFICLLFDILANGTAERIIVVDIVRPLASFVIFLVLCKAFSLFLSFFTAACGQRSVSKSAR